MNFCFSIPSYTSTARLIIVSIAKNGIPEMILQSLSGFCLYSTKCACSRPDRIIPIAERFGMDPGAVLDNVSISFLFQFNWTDGIILGTDISLFLCM